jgi:hypothetical protein
MRRGWEPFDVSPHLGEQDLGGSPTDTCNRIEPLGLVQKRLQTSSDLLTESFNYLVEAIQVRQLLAEQKLLMCTDLPSQRAFQLRTLTPQATLG